LRAAEGVWVVGKIGVPASQKVPDGLLETIKGKGLRTLTTRRGRRGRENKK